MKASISFLFLLSTIIAVPANAVDTNDNPLRPFNAHYVVERDDDTIALTNISLARVGDNHWLYRSASEPTGWVASMMGVTIVEQSDWIWFDGIKVLTYRYDQSGKEKHVHLTFDWQQMKVTNNINGDPWQMEIPDATSPEDMDRLLNMSTIPERLNRSVLDIKNGVEGFRVRVCGKSSR